MISLEKSISTRQFPVNKVIKFGPCWEVPYLWLVTYWQWHYRISSENGARLITKTPALIAAAPFPFLSPLSCFSPPPLPSLFAPATQATTAISTLITSFHCSKDDFWIIHCTSFENSWSIMAAGEFLEGHQCHGWSQGITRGSSECQTSSPDDY